ncbi:MAG TPA: MBL fold metallo-hydrolase [Thiobacillaceae bacterium]|nr:MBL fold metallo-hydrolase [Thiobacillaceae bacterium]
MPSPILIDYGHGIHAVDADYVRPGLAAMHLLIQDGRAAIIDTGTQRSAPLVLAALERLGLGPEHLDLVIVTHVHLDHAGGAGALLQACPNARLVAHPKGARHMIDPGKLIAGSIAVYGEERFHELYGDIVPAPAERVIEAPDGYGLDFRGRTLTFLDTPGHARHHFCVWDEASRGIFTGDSFGLSYREFDVRGRPFIFPTTTPVQFEPDAMHATLDRLMGLEPEAAYLTHFGRVTGLTPLADDLHRLLDAFVELANSAGGSGPERHARMKSNMGRLLLEQLRAHGCTLVEDRIFTLLENDLELNCQGLAVWLDRTARGGAEQGR